MDITPKTAYYAGLAGLGVGFGLSFVQVIAGFTLMAIGYLVTVVARPMRDHGDFRMGLKQGGIRFGLLLAGAAIFYVGPFILFNSAIAALVGFGVFIFLIQPVLERRVLTHVGLPTTHLDRDEEDPDKQTA